MSDSGRHGSRRWPSVLLALLLSCVSVTPATACDDTASHGFLSSPADKPSAPCHDDGPPDMDETLVTTDPPCTQCAEHCLAQSPSAIPQKIRLTVAPTERALPALPVACYGAAVHEPPYRPPAHVSSI